MALGILCSGQGGQHARMFRLVANEAAAKPLFEHAHRLMGVEPRTFVAAESTALYTNRHAQLLCVLQALCVAACLREQLPERRCIAGYSVGELASWSVAGVMAPEDALSLTWQRAALMDEARQCAQGMLAIRGLSRAAVNDLTLSLDAEIAISNPSDTFIVGGSRAALEALAALALDAGATRVREVRVEVASHTYLMSQAAQAFSLSLANTAFRTGMPLGVRLLSGVDGNTVQSMDEGKAKLAQQIAHPIEWDVCLRTCVEAGCGAFLELGPSRALAAMVEEVAPGTPARSVDDFQSLDGVVAWLRRVLW